jgi:hypothetical protein
MYLSARMEKLRGVLKAAALMETKVSKSLLAVVLDDLAAFAA